VTTYVWRPKARTAGVDAQATGECLDRVRLANGGQLTPERVVGEAAKKRSPLHPHFEWDDKIAAHEHRLDQARYIIRMVAVEMDDPEEGEEPVMIRAFVSIPDDPDDPDGSTHFTTTVLAMSDQGQRDYVLEKAWGEIQAFKRKYGIYEEFAVLIAAINGMVPPVRRVP
tara:strand:+ start:782 stop:1288 length:507 start_codon:yes stop_codon:yes gene_type:complete